MDLQLNGQTAVVIGGAKGIGRAIGEAFAGEGASVALLDVDLDVQAAAGEIGQQYNVPSSGMNVDATDYDALAQAVETIAASLGPHRHVVYAAGMGSGKYGFPFWNLEPNDWRRVVEVNLLGAVNATHAFAPAMVAARAGTLLYISSIAGQIGSQTDPPYSAAKAGVINFMQCAAKDLAAYDVRANAICPGMIKTTLNKSVWQAFNSQQAEPTDQTYEEWAAEKIARVAPLGRWQEPQDIATLTVFLASPQAKNITGQTMNVDGGQVMHW